MSSFYTDDNGDWFFNEARELYYRVGADGVNAMMFGRYLPDPAAIREKSGRAALPNTKALWEHWNAYNNA